MPVTNSASAVRPGIVSHFAANAVPPGWLKCNGAAVSRASYAALFLAIGTTYGAGDGATTFNLPDLRGEFLRGLDDGRGVDAGRAIGSAQADELKSHNHVVIASSGAGGGAQSFNGAPGGYAPDYVTANRGGSETRPRNVAMLACIKF